MENSVKIPVLENSIKMAKESILGLRVCAVSSVSACIVISILWCKFLPPNLSFTANYFLLGSLIFFCSFCIIGDLMMYKMNVFIKSIIGAIFFLVYPISSAVLDGLYLGYLMWLMPLPFLLYVLFAARDPETFYKKRKYTLPFKHYMLCISAMLQPFFNILLCFETNEICSKYFYTTNAKMVIIIICLIELLLFTMLLQYDIYKCKIHYVRKCVYLVLTSPITYFLPGLFERFLNCDFLFSFSLFSFSSLLYLNQYCSEEKYYTFRH
ncbi:hypothetical protein [Intestinicryptomonas porci]|uniref:Uncharacterized protein n=1 Tax=Intestinicryptomonas porci TaxID=2926320 RepID=A0ABU4WFW3_9BACT|nr:hypothetical protein [Opitutales bacterium CLA-KB-P66]